MNSIFLFLNKLCLTKINVIQTTGINTDEVLVHVDKKKLTKLQRGPWLVGEPPWDWGFLRVVRVRMRYARGLCLCPLHAFLIYLKDIAGFHRLCTLPHSE